MLPGYVFILENIIQNVKIICKPAAKCDGSSFSVALTFKYELL